MPWGAGCNLTHMFEMAVSGRRGPWIYWICAACFQTLLVVAILNERIIADAISDHK